MSLTTTIENVEAILKSCAKDPHVWEVRISIEELGEMLGFLKELQEKRDRTRGHSKKDSAYDAYAQAEQARRAQEELNRKFSDYARMYGQTFEEMFGEDYRNRFEDLFRGDRGRRYKPNDTFTWTDKKTWFEILEVSETATEAEIKKAYRRMCSKNHPDKHPKASAEELKRLNDTLKEVLQAWEEVKSLRGFS